MKPQIYHVDAFTSEPFRGNSAGVVLHADTLSDAQMQLIARELRHSETAFLLKSEESDVRIRYFTPTVEVPICGHATVAAHYVRATVLGLGNTTVWQTSLAGRHRVEIHAEHNDYRITLEQGQPSFEPPLVGEIRAAIITALNLTEDDIVPGAPIQVASTGHAKVMILYAKGANITNDKDIVDFLNLYEEAVKIDPRSPQAMIDEAVQAAKQADVVVAVVGESQGMAHEASSRTNITIPQSQRDLITALKATGKPLVLVLMNGRPLALVKEDQQADAILETWFAGTEGGNAIADVLFGDYNPSGKLPISFPRSVGQIPVYYSHLNTGRPYNPEKPNKYTSRYFDEANGPLYPFGYGLSYTTFTVSDVTLSSPTMQRDGKVTASVEVTNTGKREGATVIQMYLQDVTASMSRPVKQLKGFEKITLKPGERKTVSFPIDIEALKFWNQQMKYDAEPGKFNVFIGVDSARVKQGSFELL